MTHHTNDRNGLLRMLVVAGNEIERLDVALTAATLEASIQKQAAAGSAHGMERMRADIADALSDEDFDDGDDDLGSQVGALRKERDRLKEEAEQGAGWALRLAVLVPGTKAIASRAALVEAIAQQLRDTTQMRAAWERIAAAVMPRGSTHPLEQVATLALSAIAYARDAGWQPGPPMPGPLAGLVPGQFVVVDAPSFAPS